jgi:hypothetical protein
MAAVVRLIGLRKPAGACAVLLDYLPSAPDEAVAGEVKAALFAIARGMKNPDKALLEALRSKDPQRRAAAAGALGRDGGAYEKQPGRRCYVPGLKLCCKFIYYLNGQPGIELEMVDVQFFNSFEERLFAKP